MWSRAILRVVVGVGRGEARLLKRGECGGEGRGKSKGVIGEKEGWENGDLFENHENNYYQGYL